MKTCVPGFMLGAGGERDSLGPQGTYCRRPGSVDTFRWENKEIDK